MRGYRNKILIGIVTLVVLAVAFLYDAGAGVVQKTSNAITQENIEKLTNEPSVTPEQKDEIAELPKQSEEPIVSKEPEAAPNTEQIKSSEAPPAVSDQKNETVSESSPAPTSEATQKVDSQSISEVADSTSTLTPTPEAVTSPIPSEVPDELTCTVSIRCNTILDNLSKLDSDKVKIIPADGVILAEQTVTFEEGENVFDVLMRVTKDHKIHMEYMSTPIYKSAYIEGIANIYEFDCGELSGWQYRVNGVFPSYGCSRYTLVPGDKIEWVYTCDLGKDVGGYQDLSEE